MKKAFRYNFKLDAQVLAIVSNASEYRLISSINKAMNLEFTRMADTSFVEQINADIVEFHIYQYFDDDQELSFYIVGNKSEEGYLIKEHKEIDYFIVMYGEPSRIKIDQRLKEVNQMTICQMAFKMDADKIKNKEKLVLE